MAEDNTFDFQQPNSSQSASDVTRQETCGSAMSPGRSGETSEEQDVKPKVATDINASEQLGKLKELQAEVDLYKGQLEAKNNDLKSKIDELATTNKQNAKLSELIQQVNDRRQKIAQKTEEVLRRVGQGMVTQVGFKDYCDLIIKYSQISVLYDELKDMPSALERARSEIDNLLRRCGEEERKNQNASDAYDKLEAENEANKAQVELLGAQKARLEGDVRTFQDSLDYIRGFMKPVCLAGKDWFGSFFDDLIENVYQQQPSDIAMLVLSSLTEFSVMERNPADLCFDWEKQLVDIGCVISRYLRAKGDSEKDVRRIMNDFATVLSSCPPVKEAKIAVSVPSLAANVDTNTMRHLKDGDKVSKVLNWCVVNGNGVYRRADVE